MTPDLDSLDTMMAELRRERDALRERVERLTMERDTAAVSALRRERNAVLSYLDLCIAAAREASALKMKRGDAEMANRFSYGEQALSNVRTSIAIGTHRAR